MINMEILPKIRENILFREDRNEILAFDPLNNKIITLNKSGYVILKCCDGKTNKKDLIEAILKNTGRNKSDIIEEIDIFLEKIEKFKLFK